MTEQRLNAKIKLLSEEKQATQEKLDTVTKVTMIRNWKLQSVKQSVE